MPYQLKLNFRQYHVDHHVYHHYRHYHVDDHVDHHHDHHHHQKYSMMAFILVFLHHKKYYHHHTPMVALVTLQVHHHNVVNNIKVVTTFIAVRILGSPSSKRTLPMSKFCMPLLCGPAPCDGGTTTLIKKAAGCLFDLK
uniref:Uncharacterized protein n=1 Tax=Populus trichocarpa TaxID=3694 RepID=A0A3N7G7Y8_POPTR